MKTKSGGGRSALASASPSTGALTTWKLFNLNPLINISNHRSTSAEGIKRHSSAVGSVYHPWKERV